VIAEENLPKLDNKVEPTAERPHRTADALVDILVAAGVEVVFGLPGGAISPIYDALVDHPSVRMVTTRHESGAMFAAAGYAHATGRLAVVLVTSGPGVLNAFTGLASANCDGLPVLLIAGEVPRNRFGKNALQEGSAYELDVIHMAKGVTKMAAELHDANGAPVLLRRAIATALSGRRGPVLLTLPVDVATARIDAPRISLSPRVELGLERDAVECAARALEAARRPVIFIGAGTRWDGAPALVRELAERLQVPVMTTPKAKGVFPEDHPLSLGVFGFGSHPSTGEYLKDGIDLMLAIGTGLSEVATSGWSPLLLPKGPFIQIDTEASQMGRSYPVTLGIVGTASRVLGAMLETLPPTRRPARHFGVRRHDDGATLLCGPEGRISPQRALYELQQVMPADTLYCCDIGEHMLFAIHHLRITDPHAFTLMIGLGSMASGLGAATGVKLARPDRPVVAICGDGCFSMGLSEIGTAVRERIPFVVAVLNDRRFGMVEIGHQAIYGRSPEFPAGPMDVSGLARAVGAQALTVEHPGDLLGLDLTRFLRAAPLVLDIRIDSGVRMPTNARFDFLSKAVKRLLN